MNRTGMSTRVRGLFACLTILALLIGAPIALLLLGAIPTFDGFTWRDLLRQDDGTLALQAITIAAWITWAWCATTILLETVARLRGITTPRLPGLPQGTASRLVSAAALLFIAIPAAAPSMTPARAAATPPVPETPTPPSATAPAKVAPSRPAPKLDAPPTINYTVKRGDSLWRIADSHLGAGTRFTEIIDLNPEALAGDADFLPVGLVLRLPSPSEPTTKGESYVVKPGDTMSEVAATELHDADRYPEIFEASHDTTQPDGTHLTDPDQIQPGWTLTIPRPHPHANEPRVPAPPPLHPDAPSIRTPETRPNIATPDAAPPVEAPASAPSREAPEESEVAPSWILPGLTGGGAVLAGGLMLLLRRHYRSQRRYRVPGQEMVGPPPELRHVEKTIHLEGPRAAALIEHLDAMLRMLSEPEHVHLVAAELGHRQITLHLGEPAALPHPWTGGPSVWTAEPEVVATDNEGLAPYPLLASIGQSDDGHLWLLNLEEPGVINLTGDREQTEALARHLAAELTVTPWSMLVQVDAHRIAPELTDLDPLRLHHHDTSDFLLPLAADLDPAGRLPGFDPDRYHAVIIAEDSEAIRVLTKTIRLDDDRSGAAAVILDALPDLSAASLTITADGHLTIEHPALRDVRLRAAGLTSEEATTCAAIVEATRSAKSRPMPKNESATHGMEALIDAAGALRPEYVHERPPDLEPAGAHSLLPEATTTYVDHCATTSEDVHQLAPVVTAETRATVTALDPALDDDLAEWQASSSRLPKLTLLGPVYLRANGVVPPARRPYFAELLAYLTLHPNGVSTGEFLEAIGVSRSRLTIDLGKLRNWLGTNPRTGHDHLQDARRTPAANRLGHPAYQAEDVLVDLDLFRRLRARGEARGADGIADLHQALRLVSGEPFTQLRERGWSWLLDGQRHDHIAVSMIVDTAHLVVNRALPEHDYDIALEAAEIAMRAAPYDDVPCLDFARVLAATGHPGSAEDHIAERLYNRDDGDGPSDPPARSRRVAG
ncbi:LysM peptidoglycan-binding domain-containing protein [Nocardioides sp. YIM B13467]|uniref:LysM peptidoglycan-binding domain-containing protein n=1 Tax=Nocardioides sp. YIM B13467 TaxID=3366294 RepID=UPI003672C3AF